LHCRPRVLAGGDSWPGMRVSARIWLAASLILIASVEPARSQGVRDHTRLERDRSTVVSEAQATELTLTLTEAAVRPIQVWLRTAGPIDPTSRVITAFLPVLYQAQVKVGQRVRAFPPNARSSMTQARVSGVERMNDRVRVEVTLSGPARQGSPHYVLEIVTEPQESLSVPNEAIIETEGRHVVYIQLEQGRYVPREIQTGLRGELYTEVLDGLKAGEQVVTFGSFFVDADYKLKTP
jgi:hypothetical protein